MRFSRIANGVVKACDDNNMMLFACDDISLPTMHPEAEDQFKAWLTSNSVVGEPVKLSQNLLTLKEIYDTTLLAILNAKYGEEIGVKYHQRCMKWLDSTDFFEAPASTTFHGSYPGGLVEHSLQVYNEICELKAIPKFQSVDIASACLLALIHDWCKIELYESYNRNVKDEETGKWTQVKCYKRGKPAFPFGHGTASMFLAQRFFKLNQEECLAIQWHMGPWYVHEADHNDLQASNETYPLVHMLQFADQLSLVNY